MIIYPNHPNLQYCGRIDLDNPLEPVFIYAGSFFKITFTGRSIAFTVKNLRSYFKNSIGYLLDNQKGKLDLSDTAEETTFHLTCDTTTEHTLIVYKRMDACHYFILKNLILDEDAQILANESLPNRKLEVIGDSVSCGEVSEAIWCTASPDPEGHDGIYSDSYYSYSWIAARKLNAQLHITSQGGAALLNNTGWFHGPDYIGVESIYDKLEYNPEICETKNWDFNTWIPDVVVLAFGQNDNHPNEIFTDLRFESERNAWKLAYITFVEKLFQCYPKSKIVITTTILNHAKECDQTLDEIYLTLKGKHPAQIYRFFYTQNGCGTPGHIRIPEAEKMAEELSLYLEPLF